jgi:hypothetical protein
VISKHASSRTMDNAHSLPYDSDNGHHLDVYTFVKGETMPLKCHEILNGDSVNPTSIEGLRQRLASQKRF